jgi:hypothetical protein
MLPIHVFESKVFKMKTSRYLLLPLLALAAAMPVSALADSSWNMNLESSCTAGSCGNNSRTEFSNAGVTMTASAWATTGTTGSSGATFATATFKNWGTAYGYGVVSKEEDLNSPQHAMDNSGATEMVLLYFSQAVALTSVGLGWTGTDADISVLSYTPPTGTTADPVIDGASIAGLLTSGWSLVGNYEDLNTDAIAPKKTADIAVGAASSWWLISAYNAGFSGSASPSDTSGPGTTGLNSGVISTTTYSCDRRWTLFNVNQCKKKKNGDWVTKDATPVTTSRDYNDYFKILAVAGQIVSSPPPSETPEPAGAALVGLGLLGIMISRRRRPH